MKMRRFLQHLFFLLHYVSSIDNNRENFRGFHNVTYFPSLKRTPLRKVLPWTPIDTHCKSLLEIFSDATANFTECLLENSLPPRMCLHCADHYSHVTMAYYRLKDDREKSPKLGQTCAELIFDSYEIGYVDSLYSDLKSDVWDASKCDYCVQFVISPDKRHSHLVDFNENTLKFLRSFEQFQNCTSSSAEHENLHNSSVCEKCVAQYEEINTYYDKLFYHKLAEFCVDVESAVNDSVKLWRDLLRCEIPRYPDKSANNLSIGITCLTVFVACAGFYVFSFIIVKRKKRKLKRVHRQQYDSQVITTTTATNNIREEDHETLREPALERARLLSTGTKPKRVISYSQLPPSGLG